MKKIAVIGLGNISERHRSNLRRIFPVAKIYSMSASGRNPSSSVSNCDVLITNIETLVKENVDMAIVASPATYHAEHSIPLIKAGIPILIEKPLAASIEDAERILKISRSYITPVAVGYCLRYLPSAQRVKVIIEAQEIGELYNVLIDVGQYLPDWRPTKNYQESVSARVELGGGALLELSHELDYAQWILGTLYPKNSILRSSEELSLEVEDLADICAISHNGTVVNIHLDFLQRHTHRKCSFIGSKGRMEWDLIKNEICLFDKEGMRVLYSDSNWDKNQMYINMLNDFVNKIESKKNSCIDLENAVNTVKLIDCIKSITNQ